VSSQQLPAVTVPAWCVLSEAPAARQHALLCVTAWPALLCALQEPKVLAKRDGVWASDLEFGRQVLAGMNPW
jgi:hypothetical protein